jgi:hypothetical protein
MIDRFNSNIPYCTVLEELQQFKEHEDKLLNSIPAVLVLAIFSYKLATRDAPQRQLQREMRSAPEDEIQLIILDNTYPLYAKSSCQYVLQSIVQSGSSFSPTEQQDDTRISTGMLNTAIVQG